MNSQGRELVALYAGFPNPVEVYPTLEGTTAPPRVESANNTLATRGAAGPKLDDIMPMAIGYSEESPSPMSNDEMIAPASEWEISNWLRPRRRVWRPTGAWVNRPRVAVMSMALRGRPMSSAP